ncbi:V-set domain containing T-cell activation inhibitor 1-like [Poecilia formosa]|uniref:V-set domain containing T-cell activation inhibitor 1-like n=1 Tax=Poecilia formosa TaxID=48698 RepID=UPI000444437E|nr:PREDICTED: V-set domain containing T-cell activation inhibitor 1-like [Poecilia formosa]
MAGRSVFKTFLVLVPLLAGSEADPEVSCVFRHSCLLPCQFQSGSGLVIRWSNPSSAGDSVVHSYYDGQDQLGQQNQKFQGRTSLILDQISRGNASLLLKEVKIQDEGRYKCNISSSTGYKESFINLKIDAPVSDIRIHQDGNRITCSSEGIYPQPELTWSTEPPSNTALQNRTTVHQTEEKLYDISSSLTGPDGPDLTYSCSIRTRSSRRTETLKKGESAGGKTWKVILGLIGPAGAAAAAAFLKKKCKKEEKDGKKQKGDEEKKSKDSKKGESESFGNFSEESDSVDFQHSRAIKTIRDDIKGEFVKIKMSVTTEEPESGST